MQEANNIPVSVALKILFSNCLHCSFAFSFIKTALTCKCHLKITYDISDAMCLPLNYNKKQCDSTYDAILGNIKWDLYEG